MPRPRPIWTVAYFAGWALGVGGALALVAAVAWEAFGASAALGVDDDVALLGAPLGAALGRFAARATRSNRAVHRLLLWIGAPAAVLGAAGAAALFMASAGLRGQGPYAGLGEALAGVLAAALAAIGLVLALTGVCGRLSCRERVPAGP